MLALHGFDVYGLEVSAKGAQTARDYAANELANPRGFNYSDKSCSKTAPGTVKIIAGDFFSREWEKSLAEDGVEGFDLIYDYTVCIIIPWTLIFTFRH